ncbi:MAG: CYTH domain-containing protein [Formosimonas sp.]
MELEISLALPPDSATATRAWLVQLPHCTFARRTQLLNVYLDTPNLALKAARAALRLRFDVEQNLWLQTLKTAGQVINGVHARGEWECVVARQASASDMPRVDLNLFPAEAQQMLRAFEAELQPVFRTDFTRDIYDYRHNAAHFEWALDDGAVQTSTGAVPIHELELEHKAGELDEMRDLAQAAQTALKATPQTLSKAARGYGLLQIA